MDNIILEAVKRGAIYVAEDKNNMFVHFFNAEGMEVLYYHKDIMPLTKKYTTFNPPREWSPEFKQELKIKRINIPNSLIFILQAKKGTS